VGQRRQARVWQCHRHSSKSRLFERQDVLSCARFETCANASKPAISCKQSASRVLYGW
jgi:hypothetical protein